MKFKNYNFFSYVEAKDKLKLFYLFSISLCSNIFEILGIGLIPSYVFAISSFEEFRKLSFFGVELLNRFSFNEFILYSSILLVFFLFSKIF